MPIRTAIESERGASLVMVIVFVMVFGLITGAILDFANVGFKTTTAVAEVRDAQLAVDGAMEGAINAIRGSLTAGHLENPCDPFVYDAPEESIGDITVTCTPQTTRTGDNDDTAPKYAVLILGAANCEGYRQLGNRTVYVNGGLFSNSRVAVGASAAGCPAFPNGSSGSSTKLDVEGDVFAVGPCSTTAGGTQPKIITSGGLSCDLGAGAAEPDPNFPSAASGIVGMDVDPAPTCAPTNSIVRFAPGIYTELPVNHAIDARCNDDSNSVWWFAPGVYYFDFPEPASIWEPYEVSNSRTAEERAKAVVGGTPTNWNAATPPTNLTFPGVCDPGTENQPQPGVQFIFGGTSRLRSKSNANHPRRGAIELCAGGQLSSSQRIALYALKDGSRAETTAPIFPEAVQSDEFSSPEHAQSDDDGDAAATVTLSGDGPTAAVLLAPTFQNIPAGSLVDEVNLVLRHLESPHDPRDLTITLRLTFASGTVDIDVDPRLVMGDTTISIEDELAEVFRYRDLNSLTAELLFESSNLAPTTEVCRRDICETTPAETIDIAVESLRLEATHTPPGFRKHECPAATPDCSVVQTTAGTGTTSTDYENPRLRIEGTVYAPTAKLTVGVHNDGRTGFRRGVLVRTLVVDGSASSTQPATDRPFQLPISTKSRVVLFQATIAGEPQPSLRARVRYIDSDGADTVPGHEVRVLSWAPIR